MSIIKIVTLEWYELRFATQVGTERRIRAMEKGRKDCNLESDSNRWTDHIEGACAECAVAKLLGIYWPASIDTYRDGGDVGPYQVRSSAAIADLVVRPRDHDEAIFIKVYGRSPTFRIFGWIRAVDAKKPEWLHDRGNGGPPAYWVPPEFLYVLDDLPSR